MRFGQEGGKLPRVNAAIPIHIKEREELLALLLDCVISPALVVVGGTSRREGHFDGF
jgi:hypothetical protein